MADDSPQTLVEAIARDLATAAYGGAMDITLDATDADTPLRRMAVRACNAQFDKSWIDDARNLIEHLNQTFGLGLDPERVPGPAEPDPATAPVHYRRHGADTMAGYLRRWFPEAPEQWTWQDAERGIRAAGWTTDTADVRSILAPVLSRFARDGEITRVYRGVYTSTPRSQEGMPS